MTKRIDINLAQIETIMLECVSGGRVSNDLEELEKLMSDTQKHIGFGNGLAYLRLESLLEEIDDNIRGIANNVEDLGNGCKKYYNKMIELGEPVTSYDDNMLVSDDFTKVRKKYKRSGYSEDLRDAKKIISILNDNVFFGLGNGLIVDYQKLRSFNNSVDSYCDTIKLDIDNVIKELEFIYEKLKDVEGFKSHEYNEALNIGARVVVATAVAVATTVVAAALLPEAAAVAAVIATEAAISAAGTAIVKGAQHYYNGSDVKEAAAQGATEGIKTGITSVVTAGIARGKASGVKSIIEEKPISIGDDLLRTSEYNGMLNVGNIEAEFLDETTLGLTKSQIKYIKNKVVDELKSNTKSKTIEEIKKSLLEEIGYDIENSKAYEEMTKILEELNIELNGDDIWQNN